MHIIGIILGVVIFIVVWWARLKMLGEVAHKAADVVDTAIKAPRRWAFKRQTSGNPVDHIDDPRVGAVCLMYILASSDGILDQNEVDIIEGQTLSKFCENETELEDLSTYSRWVAGRISNHEQAAKKLVRTIHKLAPSAGSELMDMVTNLDVKSCESGLFDDVVELIKRQFKLV